MDDHTLQKKVCETDINSSIILSESVNEGIKPIGINGPLVAKIPVVIAEPVIQVNNESVLRLEEPALEIKRIKKNVYLTQCKLIDTNSPKSGKLFISGFVRKNVEYATADAQSAERGSISGDIRHSTFRVPFSCVTEVYYDNPPITRNSGFSKEIEIFTNKLAGCDPCAQHIIGQDPCEQDFEHFESFTDRIYCELVDVKIFEEDVHQDPEFLGCEFPNEQVFQRFVEKMVLYIKVKVLQRQQVNVPKKCACADKKNNCIPDKKEHKKWRYEYGSWKPCD